MKFENWTIQLGTIVEVVDRRGIIKVEAHAYFPYQTNRIYYITYDCTNPEYLQTLQQVIASLVPSA